MEGEDQADPDNRDSEPAEGDGFQDKDDVETQAGQDMDLNDRLENEEDGEARS